MKNIFRIAFAAITLVSLSSCCSLFSCGAGKTVSKEVTTYQDVERQISVGSAKEGLKTQTVIDQVAVTQTVDEKVKCPKCMTTFCPKRGCCGTTSDVVIKRATAQNATGNPHIGLIPTMKPLAE